NRTSYVETNLKLSRRRDGPKGNHPREGPRSFGETASLIGRKSERRPTTSTEVLKNALPPLIARGRVQPRLVVCVAGTSAPWIPPRLGNGGQATASSLPLTPNRKIPGSAFTDPGSVRASPRGRKTMPKQDKVDGAA